MTTSADPAHLDTPSAPTMTARSPEDLLAAVPLLLGFEPADSIVMLTFSDAPSFHARLDLPDVAREQREQALEEVTECLLGPVRRQRVRQVVFVIYSADEAAVRRTGRHLIAAFRRAGVEVVDAMRADAGRWFTLTGRPGVPAWGVPYDVSLHPFRLRGVMEGRVTHASRAELAGTLSEDPVGSAAVLAAIKCLTVAGVSGALDEVVDGVVAPVAVGSDLEPEVFPDEVLAALLVGMSDLLVRDAVWGPMTRDSAPRHVRLWTDAVRRTPGELVADPAAVLGFAAWLAGQGALAWCAVDRCREVDPDHTLAQLVADLLTHAVSPRTYSDVSQGPANP